jgi:hypothetical protein
MKKLTQADIERLARTTWRNTGCGELPVLPQGRQYTFRDTGIPLTLKELNPVWEDVQTKDIYRRQAIAVALELGFELEPGVKPVSR